MFKFLRKYNTIILAVGGTLLLIVFLIPQAIESLSQQGGLRAATVATWGPNGELKMKHPDLVQARAELEVVRGLGGINGVSIETPEHWYLLCAEANAAGLIGGISLSDADVQTFSSLTGKSPSIVRTTLAKISGVGAHLGMFSGGMEYSRLRLAAEGQRLFHAVVGPSVVIQGRDDVDVPAPTEAELQAQFEQYKDVLAGEGDDVFGYRLPNRVQLEWIRIDAAALRDHIAATDGADAIELRKHWKRVEGTKGIPLIADLEDGADVPEAVVEEYIDLRLEQRLKDIRRYGQEQLRRPQRVLEGDDLGFLALPDDWQQRRTKLDALADSIRERFGIDRPTRHAEGSWLEPEDLRGVEGLGLSFTDDYGQRLNLTNLMTHLREFGGLGAVPVQDGVAGPPMVDGSDNLFFFRITAAAPSAPPESLDEVREQVASDLRRKADYEALAADPDAIRSEAARGGLVTLAMKYDTKVERPQQVSLIDPLTRILMLQGDTSRNLVPTALPVIGGREDVVSAIVEHGQSLDLTVAPTELSAEDRIVVVPVPDQLVLYVFQINSQIPFSQEDYDAMAEQLRLQQVLLRLELDEGTAITDAFSEEAMFARHNFERVASDDDDEDAEGDDGDPDDDPVASAE